MSSAERQPPARWPWVVLAGFFALSLMAFAFVVVNGEPVFEQIPYMIAFTMFGVVGATIVSRDRRNPIGGMLLWASVVTALSFLSGELLTYLLVEGVQAEWVAVLGLAYNMGWVWGILPVLFLLPVFFPDGSLPSRRWRPYVGFVIALLVALSLGLLFGQELLTGSSDDFSVENPLYVAEVGTWPKLDPVFALLYPLLFGLAVLSLVLRFRRAEGDQRQQIKWVVFGLVAALVGVLLSVPLESPLPTLAAVIGGAAFLAFPASIGASVLRYRLYDLDVVVKKALVAGMIAGSAIIAYGVIVTLVGRMTSEVSSGVVFLVALVLGAAFRPAIKVARKIADRLVYGRRATPYEVLTAFSGRVGEAYATEDVLERMSEILARGVGAEAAKVWLRVGGELRVEGVWPIGDGAGRTLPIRGNGLPEIPGEEAVEVRDRDELLGALSVRMPADDPMNPAKGKLVRDLAAQAGLVLRNVRLVEELRASQRRIVAAQDEERRRLERNIHDGAQQQLVALAVKARLARTLTGRDPAKAEEMLAQIETETQVALEDLRDLARGIYPPLLADEGLAAALRAQARRAPVPVTVEADGVGRFPRDVEAAAYFSCLEALQNIGKYAQASAAAVRLSSDDRSLRFEVTDDGVGFDPTATGFGTGLRGIADRLGALEGRLDVVSAIGSGTKVRGELPIPVATGTV